MRKFAEVSWKMCECMQHIELHKYRFKWFPFLYGLPGMSDTALSPGDLSTSRV